MAFFLAIGITACAQPPAELPANYSLIIADGLVVPGEGKPARVADIGIVDGRIVAIGDLNHAAATTKVDASGLIVTPGFVDIHSHALRQVESRSGIFLYPDAENLIRQGITSVIGGPDGGSPLPIRDYLKRLANAPASVNFGTFVGHGSVRAAVMGNAFREATSDELQAMRQLVDEAMHDGALGLSSGLIYTPGRFAGTTEVAALAAIAARHNGIYISHVRHEGSGVVAAVKEAIEIGHTAGIPVQITHIKVMGQPNWGGSANLLHEIDAARARGQDVTADLYPYAASSTGLTATFPGWALAGDTATRRSRLVDPANRQRVQQAIKQNLSIERGGDDPASVRLAHCPFDTRYDGKTLTDVLTEQELPTTIDHAAALIVDLQIAGGCTAVYHAMDEADVAAFLRHPAVMVASDGGIVKLGVEMPHPRNYGAFARILARYVREKQTISLEAAIHKMATMPANRVGLSDRGRIAPGAIADLVVLDLETIADLSSFTNPHQYAAGVRDVLVNGQFVLRDGVMTGARPGQIILRPQSVVSQAASP